MCEETFDEFSKKAKAALGLAEIWARDTFYDKSYLFSEWLETCLEFGDFVTPDLIYDDIVQGNYQHRSRN